MKSHGACKIQGDFVAAEEKALAPCAVQLCEGPVRRLEQVGREEGWEGRSGHDLRSVSVTGLLAQYQAGQGCAFPPKPLWSCQTPLGKT